MQNFAYRFACIVALIVKYPVLEKRFELFFHSKNIAILQMTSDVHIVPRELKCSKGKKLLTTLHNITTVHST